MSDTNSIANSIFDANDTFDTSDAFAEQVEAPIEATQEAQSEVTDGEVPDDLHQTTATSQDTEVKPTTTEDPTKAINELLTKANLTYKSNGKSYKVDSIESLIRVAQRSKPIEDQLEDLNRQKEMIIPVVQLINQMRGEDDELSEAALLQVLPRERVMKVAEKLLRAQYEEELNGGPMTERERALKAEVEAHKNREKAELTRQEQLKEQARLAQENKNAEAIRNHIAASVSSALELMDLPPKLEPLAVQLMKPIMSSMLKNKIALDPEILAEKVGPMFEEMLNYKVRNLEGEKLLKFFGDDTGKKFRKALLSQMGAKPTVVTKPVVQTERTAKDTAKVFKDSLFEDVEY